MSLISSKNEQKQVDLRFHSSKAEYVSSFFLVEMSAWKNHFNFVWPLTFDEQDICHFRFFSKAITQIKILWKFEIGDLVFSWKKLMNSSPVPVSDANCLRMLSRWERTSKVSSENAQYIINFDYLHRAFIRSRTIWILDSSAPLTILILFYYLNC